MVLNHFSLFRKWSTLRIHPRLISVTRLSCRVPHRKPRWSHSYHSPSPKSHHHETTHTHLLLPPVRSPVDPWSPTWTTGTMWLQRLRIGNSTRVNSEFYPHPPLSRQTCRFIQTPLQVIFVRKKDRHPEDSRSEMIHIRAKRIPLFCVLDKGFTWLASC